MAASTRCSVCNSPNREAIHAALWKGIPRTRVAEQYGVHVLALGRHFHSGHVPPNPDPSPKTKVQRARGKSPLEIARAVVDDLQKQDTSAMAPRMRLDHLNALMKATETVARYEGPTEMTVTVAEVQGLPELLATMFKALEPFPDARLAMLEAVRKHNLEHVLG